MTLSIAIAEDVRDQPLLASSDDLESEISQVNSHFQDRSINCRRLALYVAIENKKDIALIRAMFENMLDISDPIIKPSGKSVNTLELTLMLDQPIIFDLLFSQALSNSIALGVEWHHKTTFTLGTVVDALNGEVHYFNAVKEHYPDFIVATGKLSYVTSMLLIEAVKCNNVNLASGLLKIGANVDEMIYQPILPAKSLLSLAIENKCQAMIELLFGNHISIAVDEYGFTALHQASFYPEIIDILLGFGIDPTIKTRRGGTALQLLVNHYHNESENKLYLHAVKRLIAVTDIHSQDIYGNTALHEAARAGNLDAVKLLIVAGADVNVVNEDGDTPLFFTVYYYKGERTDETIAYLLTCHTDLNIVPHELNRSSFVEAKIVDILGNRNPSQYDINRLTVLFHYFEKHQLTSEFLDAHHPSLAWSSPRSYAERVGNPSILHVLSGSATAKPVACSENPTEAAPDQKDKNQVSSTHHESAPNAENWQLLPELSTATSNPNFGLGQIAAASTALVTTIASGSALPSASSLTDLNPHLTTVEPPALWTIALFLTVTISTLALMLYYFNRCLKDSTPRVSNSTGVSGLLFEVGNNHQDHDETQSLSLVNK